MKLFLLLRSTFIFGYTIASIFLNFYIFQYTKSLNHTILFNIALFGATPIGATFAAFICKKVSCSFGNAIGVGIYMISIFLVLLSPVYIIHNLIFFGLISGLGQGFYFLSTNVITQYMTSNENREEINGIIVVVSNIASVIIPLVSFIVFFTKSYVPIFILILLFFFLSYIFVLLLHIDMPTGNLHIIKSIKIFIRQKDVRISFQTILYNGIFSIIQTVILPLLVLSALANIASWGIFNTFLNLFSIILAKIYTHIANRQNEKFFFVATSFLYATIGLLLGLYYNNYLLFLYTFMTTVMNVIMNITYPSTLQNIVDEFSSMHNYLIEYQVLIQYIYAIAEVGILLLIYLFHIPILNNTSISITFIIITIIPLLIGSLLAQTNIFNQ